MPDERLPYPFPPAPTIAELPAAVPWDSAIADLAGLWLECRCGCGENAYLPLRRLAAQLGWKRTLRTILPRLKCSSCGGRPDVVNLLAEPASKTAPRHVLTDV